MKPEHFTILHDAIEKALDEISRDGNPQYVYEALVMDMSKGAALIYDACMAGQEFMENENA